ncbi:MAG: metallophosphoesterase [Candidatus Pacearchaeota archaeon]
MENEFIFIEKTAFFPKQGILAFGDLHIGYEQALRDSGFMVPETQIKELLENIKEILDRAKSKNYTLKKIIFLGDLKHYFGYEWREKFYFNQVLDLLKNYVKEEDVILIKGNHDTFDFTGKKMEDYHIDSGIAFLHGHKSFPEIFSKEVKTLVTGHLHPSILLSDDEGIKKEKYKSFLVGKYKNKQVLILPSFFGMIEGTPVNMDYKNEDPDKEFSIIPKKELKKFNAYAIGKDGEIFNFGELRKVK